MKKITLLISVLLIVQNIVFSQKLSQDFTVTTATPYQVIDAKVKEYFSLDNGFAIMAKMHKGIVYLQKFDVNGMKEVARNTYEDLPDGAYFHKILKLKGKYFFVYEVKKKENFVLESREITSDATFKKPVELISTSRNVTNSKYNLGDLRNSNPGASAMLGIKVSNAGKKFIFSESFDGSKLMVNYRLTPVDKDDSKNYDEIGFYVFDNDLTKIWGKEIKMPLTEKDMNNVSFSISKDGLARMLITNNPKKTYEILLIDQTGKITQKDLGVSTKNLVRDLSVKEDEAGNMVCVGYYANGIEYKPFSTGFVFNANGIFYIKIDPEGNVLGNKLHEFSKELIQQNLTKYQKGRVEKREADGKAGILDLVLIEYIVKDDGSAVLIGERHQSIIRKNNNFGYTTTYYYSNMIASKIDKDGELIWQKKLPKNQTGTTGVGQMSFAYMSGPKADYVAYVDNPKNIALGPDDGVPARHMDGAGGYLTTYKIDLESGNLEKHTICELMKIGKISAYQFKTSRILKVAEGTFLMEVYIKGKKDTMVKIVMN